MKTYLKPFAILTLAIAIHSTTIHATDFVKDCYTLPVSNSGFVVFRDLRCSCIPVYTPLLDSQTPARLFETFWIYDSACDILSRGKQTLSGAANQLGEKIDQIEEKLDSSCADFKYKTQNLGRTGKTVLLNTKDGVLHKIIKPGKRFIHKIID